MLPDPFLGDPRPLLGATSFLWEFPPHPPVLPGLFGCSQTTPGCSQTTPGCSLTLPRFSQHFAQHLAAPGPLLGSFRLPLCFHGTPSVLPEPLWVLLDCSQMFPAHPPVLPELSGCSQTTPDTAQVLPGLLGCLCPHLAAPDLFQTLLWVLLEPSRSSHPHLRVSRTLLGPPRPPLDCSRPSWAFLDTLRCSLTVSWALPEPSGSSCPLLWCSLALLFATYPLSLFLIPEAPREIQESVSEV